MSGRRPSASINFITAHDGFTLRDLWSYNDKHNEANGEDNRDGENNNHSWNCGVEGHTDDKTINALRAKMQRNMLCTLFLSQGVPMLTMGDEYGRTQDGNNNAYCQDNEISWFGWDWTAEQRSLHSFTRALIALRKDNHIFHRRRFFNGHKLEENTLGDILWVNASGQEMTIKNWSDPRNRSLGMILNGEAMIEFDERGRSIKDDIFLLTLNAWSEGVNFTLPGVRDLTHWECLINTNVDYLPIGTEAPADTELLLAPRSLSLFVLKNQKANRSPEGKRMMNIVDQVRRLWDLIQE
jgi:glycogen operon protein